MKKIMEVYSNGEHLLLKNNYKVYHLFGAPTEEIDTQHFKVASTRDAMSFMVQFFTDKMKIKKTSVVTASEFGEKVHFHLEIKKPGKGEV